jgi:hypothetical protein
MLRGANQGGRKDVRRGTAADRPARVQRGYALDHPRRTRFLKVAVEIAGSRMLNQDGSIAHVEVKIGSSIA